MSETDLYATVGLYLAFRAALVAPFIGLTLLVLRRSESDGSPFRLLAARIPAFRRDRLRHDRLVASAF